MATTTKEVKAINKKVDKAVGLLKDAGTDGITLTRSQIRNKYETGKENLGELKGKTVDATLQFVDDSKATAQDLAKRGEKEVRNRPFHYIAGFSIVALILGYIFGKRR